MWCDRGRRERAAGQTEPTGVALPCADGPGAPRRGRPGDPQRAASAGSAEHGHAVESAAHRAGRPGARRHPPPDLVVLDLGLPDLDGAAMLRMLRGGEPGAGDRRDRPRRRGRDRRGARRRRRRLPGQAVQRGAARRPHPGGAAPRRRSAPARPAVVVGGLRMDPRARRASLDGRRAGAHPARVRPAALPGRPRRAGGHQARAADRGVAAALRRRGQDRRRAPVLAAPQARRDRAGSPATCTRCAASGCASRRPGAERGCARGCCCWSAATTSLVLVAFLVPLALLVRTVAADRAVQGATRARRRR